MLPQAAIAGNNKAQRSCSQQVPIGRPVGGPRDSYQQCCSAPPQPKILIWGVLQLKRIQPGLFECLLFPLLTASLEGSNDAAKDPFAERQKMEAGLLSPLGTSRLLALHLPHSAQPKQSALPWPVWADLSRAAYFCRGLSRDVFNRAAECPPTCQRVWFTNHAASVAGGDKW